MPRTARAASQTRRRRIEGAHPSLATALCKTPTLRADLFCLGLPTSPRSCQKPLRAQLAPESALGRGPKQPVQNGPPPSAVPAAQTVTLSFLPNNHCGARGASITATPWRWRRSPLGSVLGGHQAAAPAIAAAIRYRASTNSVATSSAVKLTAIRIGAGVSFVVASSSRGARRP